MRRIAIFTAGIVAAATVLLSSGTATSKSQKDRSDATDQVILRLLYQPTTTAIEDYYKEHRQYWRQEILNVQKVPQSPYYKVVIRVETFQGAHNPPYGLETLTFYVGPLDKVQLISFEHQDEPD